MNNQENSKHLPLEGVLVLAAEHMIAAPMATQILADMGAEVIKVEKPNDGESGRGSGPFLNDVDGNKVASTMYRVNRNKKSICLDLTKQEGKDIFISISKKADVVIENFRPGVMDKLGLGYKDLKNHNKKLVYVSLSGYGHKDLLHSPYSEWVAYGNIGEALGGITNNLMSRSQESEPLGFHGLSLGDIFTSLNGSIGLLIALYDAQRTGKGRYVDISMMDSLFLLNERPMMLYSLTGKKPSPETNYLSFIIGDFRAKDGWFTLSVFVEKHWKKFCEILMREDLLTNPDFDTPEKRANQIESFFRPVIEEWACHYTKHEAAEILRNQGIASAPILDPEDLVEDPHIKARNMLIDFPIAGGKTLQIVGNPIKMSDTEITYKRPPNLGENTAEVLKQHLEFNDDQINELNKNKII